MCGIAGVIDWTHDARGRRDAIEHMTEVMLCRGRDEQDIWCGDSVAFGHTRTSVIDPAGGQQPMSVTHDGRNLATICYNGEIYNYRELRQELAGRGHRFRTNSDTEVLLHSYLEWGTDCVHRLHGIFAFAVWDERSRELLLIRDHVGVKPLFYASTSNGLLFGSEPKVMFCHPELDPAVDDDGLRELFSQAKTPGTSIYKNVLEVRPGSILRVKDGRLSESCYWRLTAQEHPHDLDATIDAVRTRVSDTITEQLVADIPRGVLVSGGIDSSTIAALAAPRLREEGDPPLAFGMTFTGYEENFRPDEVRATPDIAYARLLRDRIGLELTEIELSAEDLADPQLRAALVDRQDQPTALGDMDASLYLLFNRVKRDIGVALSGDTADEVFAGFVWSHNPELMNAPTFPWVAVGQLHGRASRGLGCGLLDGKVLEKLDLSGYTRAQYEDTLAETSHLPGEDALQRRIREIDYMHMTRWLPSLLDRGDRLAMSCGLEVRVPFCDPALVEYAYNIPWSIKSFDGREKSLLRAAFRGVVPDEILDRRKSPYPVTQDGRYAALLCRQLTAVLDDRSSPVADFVDARAARAVAAEPERLASGAGAWAARSDVEMVLNLDVWLRSGVTVTF
ncbi:asparagine synthase (glutamine-hydrolyzing) [Streptomyces albus subsp. chlorinus]|uniref:asparagine synthase (glutamine-hydrolyzing) n=1 Tax=Streptomyces albus TaxID=1888 RepID=UPI00156F7E5B|nr:asparagine synthase (glutamine-hydrolyzing) [Streptomyces albus]NSC21547.1 asparagine synthase (glutamine-hydrolyzing) [Streptomyces albus subsp. chlorinus]